MGTLSILHSDEFMYQGVLVCKFVFSIYNEC